MLSEDKFFEKAGNFSLYPTVDKKYFTLNEFKEKIKDLHKDKDDKIIILYSSNVDEQHSYIESAKEKGYEILLLDSPIVPHLIQKLETKNEKLSFVRVDSDSIENLIKKDEATVSKLSDEEKDKVITAFEKMGFSGITQDKLTDYLQNIKPPKVRGASKHGQVPWSKDLFGGGTNPTEKVTIKDESARSKNTKENLLIDRWSRIAGLLNE